ncbi:MAG: hypothetical protein A4E19_07290 [Nitrospira sp. SG-bin1]|nr:MAG: hypothetical protein A4E19_07290 [Nitrospira sp. SG-bin1]
MTTAVRTWLHRVLEDRGYQVRGVGDGKEALAYLERVKPALIVLDLFMPNMVHCVHCSIHQNIGDLRAHHQDMT